MNKYFITLLTCILISSSVFAQGRKSSPVNWLTISLKGGYGVSSLMNQNVFGDKNVTPNYLSGSYVFGGRLGVIFSNVVGVSVDRKSTHLNSSH